MYRMFKTLPTLAIACAAATDARGLQQLTERPVLERRRRRRDRSGPQWRNAEGPGPAVVSHRRTTSARQPPADDDAHQREREVRGRDVLVRVRVAHRRQRASSARTTLAAGDGTTSWVYPTDLERDTSYKWRGRARMGPAVGPWSATVRFITVFEKRTPDPDPNSVCFDSVGNVVRGCIPPPNMLHIVHQVIAANPGILVLHRSCQEGWGTTFEAGSSSTSWSTRSASKTRALATTASEATAAIRRWTSSPITTAPVPTKDSSRIWAWDVITGHCGPGAAPGWSHITNIHGSRRRIHEPRALVKSGCQGAKVRKVPRCQGCSGTMPAGTSGTLAPWHLGTTVECPSTATSPIDRRQSPTSAALGAGARSDRGSAC